MEIDNSKMEDSEETKEARRRKIKQLEASLFGGGGPTQAREMVTGLPDLQRVDEYAARYALAEQQKKKSSGLPSLKKQAKKLFFPDPRSSSNKSHFD